MYSKAIERIPMENQTNEKEMDYKRHYDAAQMAKEIGDSYSCYENFMVCFDLACQIKEQTLDKEKSDRYARLAAESEAYAKEALAEMRLPPSEISKLSRRKLPKGFDQFIGEDKLKDYLNSDLIPFWNEHRMSERKTSAILLYGPEGVSKSVFVQSLIHELKATPYYINPMDNYSPFGDNTKEQMLRLFRMAEEKNNVVFYFTKPVCFFPNESSKMNKATAKLFLNLVRKEIKRIRKKNLNILFIASTSCPDKMNAKAFQPGLFDDLLRIHHPGSDTRRRIMEERLKGIPFESKDAINRLTAFTHGFISKDISRLCRRIRYVSELYKKDKGDDLITDSMLERITKDFGPLDDVEFQKHVGEFEKSLKSTIHITDDL